MTLIEQTANFVSVQVQVEIEQQAGRIPNWLELERNLHRHLTENGFLPLSLPCGCCEVVGVRILLTTRGPDILVDFEAIKRPLRQYLH